MRSLKSCQSPCFLLCLLLIALGATPARAQMPADDPRWADPATQTQILALARRAFDAYALRREVIDPPLILPDLLRERFAVFVSAQRSGAPRCCMGTLYPTQPDAAEEIIASAVAGCRP